MADFPFPQTPELTAIALAYRNGAYIADDVLPRTPVNMKTYKFRKFNEADPFTITDTTVGRTSAPNQVESNWTEASSICKDYGLEEKIPQDDIDNAPPGYDPAGAATEYVTNQVLLDRERRVAAKVFAASVYSAANKTTLSGTDQLSDPQSDALGLIDGIYDGLIMRPNVMVMGRKVFTALRKHPQLVQARNRTTGDAGRLTLQELKDLLEIENIFVGEAFLNSAKPNAATSLVRVWGNHIALFFRDTLSGPQRGMTFGFTAQVGTRISGRIGDSDIGLKGGFKVRVGEQVDENICCPAVGYFIQNAVA